jgi:membrane-associated protease RseP (regulator of RpoE activity)
MNLPGLGPIGLAVLALFTALPAPAETGGAFLGVAVQPAGPTIERQLELPPAQGLVVEGVAGGSPADRAGIRPHDILLELNGQFLFVPEQLEGLLRNSSTQTPAFLELVRAREKLRIELMLASPRPTLSDPAPIRVTIVRAPSGMDGPALADFIPTTTPAQPASASQSSPLSSYFGLRLGVVSPAVLAHLPPEQLGGAVILAVAAGSPAEAASLEAHDIIVQLDQQPIFHPNDLFEKLRTLQPQTQLLCTVLRQGQVLERPVRLAAPTLDTPPDFDQLIGPESGALPPFDVLPETEWLIVVKSLPANSPPTPDALAPTAPPTLVIEGATMTIRIEGDPLNRQATITDPHGSVLYRGGITTEADRLQMPRHIWARVAELIDPSNLVPRAAPPLESDQLWDRPLAPDWL